MFVDTHSHIYFDSYNSDRNKLLDNLEKDELDFIISVGIDIESSKKSVELSNKYQKIYATVGIHPSESNILGNNEIDMLKSFFNNKKVVALGEIGLDYYRNYQPVDVQRKAFRLQLELAEELKKPVVIHDRDSKNEVYEHLKAFNGKVKGIMHAYSGNYELAKKMMNLGYYISITGVVTYKKALDLQDVVKKVPLEFLLSETDCPFLTPEPHRGHRNQPAYVKYVVKRIAYLTGIDEDYVVQTLVENAKKAFQI